MPDAHVDESQLAPILPFSTDTRQPATGGQRKVALAGTARHAPLPTRGIPADVARGERERHSAQIVNATFVADDPASGDSSSCDSGRLLADEIGERHAFVAHFCGLQDVVNDVLLECNRFKF